MEENKRQPPLLDPDQMYSELEKKIDDLSAGIQSGTVTPAATSKAKASDAANTAVKATPKPAVKKAPPMASAEAEAVWKEMTARIQKSDITAWSFLSQGRLISGSNNHFVWQANQKEGENLYISSLNQPERNKKICDLLSELTGAACTMKAEPHGAAPADDGSDDAYLAKIIETFGSEPVDVVDEIRK